MLFKLTLFYRSGMVRSMGTNYISHSDQFLNLTTGTKRNILFIYSVSGLMFSPGSDSLKLQASFVGFSSSIYTIIPDHDYKIDFALLSRNILDEVIVSAEKSIT